MYKTKRWEAKRQSVLRRDEYKCKECSRYGRSSQASPVHHIYPAEDYPEYAWETWNLISLCKKCHNAMHDRVTKALTALGLALKQRTTPPL